MSGQHPTPQEQVSIHMSYLFMCKCVVCLVCVLGWRDGEWKVTSYFSIILASKHT